MPTNLDTYSPQEKRVVDELLRNIGEYVSASDLIKAIYGSESTGDLSKAEKLLRVVLHNVRVKLDWMRSDLVITNKYRTGYKIARRVKQLDLPLEGENEQDAVVTNGDYAYT